MEHTDRRSKPSGGTAAVQIILLLAVLVGSFVLRNVISNPESTWNKPAIESLDHKQETVMALTASATGASLLVSTLPGDIGTSIADELGKVTSKLAGVLAIILLEKYLLTIFQYITLAGLIPLCCLLLIGYVLSRKRSYRFAAGKFLLLSIVLCGTIPASEAISSLVEKTYETSISTTIANANETVQLYSEELDAAEAGTVSDKLAVEGETETEEQSPASVGEVIMGAASSAASAISGAADSAVNAVSGVVFSVTDTYERFNTILNDFVESVAVMIVLCCLMPLITCLIMFYSVKQILGLGAGPRPELPEHVHGR